MGKIARKCLSYPRKSHQFSPATTRSPGGVIGVPYEVKGEAVVCFVDLKLGTDESGSSLENPAAVTALAEGT